MVPKHRSVCLVILLIPMLVMGTLASYARADESAVQIPSDLKPSLDKLLELTVQNDRHPVDMEAVGRVVDYLLTQIR